MIKEDLYKCADVSPFTKNGNHACVVKLSQNRSFSVSYMNSDGKIDKAYSWNF